MGETRWAQVTRDFGRGDRGGQLPRGFSAADGDGAVRSVCREPAHGPVGIRELQDLGLVSRRKKIGTRVEAAHPSAGYRQSLASVEDLVQFGASHRREVQEIESVIADRALAKTLGCEPGSSWLRVSSLRLKTQGQVRAGAPGRLDGRLCRPSLRRPSGHRAGITRRAYQHTH
jgi:GntR family transcriptional regulator